GKVFSACASALFLIAALPSVAARAEPDAASQMDQAIATHMQQKLAEEARIQAWQGQRHRLDTTLLNSTEQLQPCTGTLTVTTSSDDPSPLARQRLEVNCAGTPGWKVTALVQASVFLPVVHAARVIERGQTITGEQLQLQEVNIGKASRGFYNSLDEVIGQGAKRRVRAGHDPRTDADSPRPARNHHRQPGRHFRLGHRGSTDQRSRRRGDPRTQPRQPEGDRGAGGGRRGGDQHLQVESAGATARYAQPSRRMVARTRRCSSCSISCRLSRMLLIWSRAAR